MDWRTKLRDELSCGNVICVGISSMTGPQILGALEAAAIIRRYAPDVPIVWGGVHPSLLPEQTIRHDLVDIVVVGDGEQTFKDLVETIQQGGSLGNIKGLVFKDKGTVIKTPMREPFPIEKLGPLAYDLLDMSRYRSRPLWTERPSLPIITSRGCPHRCGYCYNTEFSKRRWQSLSPGQTVSEIVRLVNEYQVEALFLLDDNFFVNQDRVKEICHLIIRKNIDIDFYNANCRADTVARMDIGLLRLLKKAGFKQLYVGVESGSDHILSQIQKDITTEQVREANRKLRETGIKPFYSFMAGFPFETIDELRDTLRLMGYLLEENPACSVFRLQLYTPFPGTDLYRHIRRLGTPLPTKLDQWAKFHYDRINLKSFDFRHKRQLEDYHLYTSFLDRKLNINRAHHFRLIANVYSGLLRLRLRRGYLSSNPELVPIKVYFTLKQKLQAICHGKSRKYL